MRGIGTAASGDCWRKALSEVAEDSKFGEHFGVFF
jgi:hypothetical protein